MCKKSQRNTKKSLPFSMFNKQLYKDYEKRINKIDFIEKIREKDFEIKQILLNNELNLIY